MSPREIKHLIGAILIGSVCGICMLRVMPRWHASGLSGLLTVGILLVRQ